MSENELKIACRRWLTTVTAAWRKADVRHDGDEVRKSVFRFLVSTPNRLSSSPQGNPEQVRGEAPLEVDIAAGPEASGMLRLVRPRMDGLQCPAPAVAASSSSRDRPEEIDPDAPLRVDFAAKVAFPHGGLTVQVCGKRSGAVGSPSR